MARARQAVVIGGGFAGLSAACYLARAGYRTVLLEKNKSVGGRAQFYEESGYKFSLGPNWYMMPDIYEDFFQDFGYKPEDYYTLTKLSPAYRSFSNNKPLDALEFERMADQLDGLNFGDGLGFKRLVNRSKLVYSTYKISFLQKVSRGASDLFSIKFITSRLKLPTGTLTARFSKFVHSKQGLDSLTQLSSSFGSPASTVPAVYSFLPYTVFEQGVWYPGGGFNSVLSGLKSLAAELGVEVYEGYEVEKVETQYSNASAVILKDIKERIPADIIISATDYQHGESLLPENLRNYKPKFWSTKQYSDSALIISLGLNTKLNGLLHHNNFTFDSEETKNILGWPSSVSSFYVACASKTDPSTAPEGGESLTITVPVPLGLQESEDSVKNLKDQVYQKLSEVTGVRISEHIQVEKVETPSYFKNMFYAPGGSASGLAHTPKQVLWRRPRVNSKRLTNFFYAGQDTNPGVSVPLAITSGKIAAYSALGKKPEVRL